MFKKLIAAALLFTAFAGVASAAQDSPNTPDVWRVTSERVAPSSGAASVDYYGNILPGVNLSQDIGESTHAWKTVYSGSLNVSSGIVNFKDIWTDIPAASETLLKAGGFSTSSTTLVAGGTTFLSTDLTQLVYPRNIVIRSTFAVANSSTILAGGATIYGVTAMGTTAYELIQFSTTSSIGNIAWATISSITVQITSNSNLNSNTFDAVGLLVGASNQMGLTNAIPSVSNAYKLNEGGANVPVGNALISTIWYTIRFTKAPNGTLDYEVWYKAKRSTP